MADISIALQLYTVRDQLKDDFAGTIKQVAKIGYHAIETGASGDLPCAKEDRKAFDDNGLTVCACMPAIELLEQDMNKVLEEADIFGTKNIVVPWMPEARRKDAAGWRNTAETLNRLAARCQQRSFVLAYHNHSFEFEKFDGTTGLDILYNNSDPKLLRAEVDTYWVQHGGVDPVQYVNKLGKRILILHLKDMAPGPERRFAPVGMGIIDFKAIIAAAQKSGIQWGVVEQDNCYDVPPLQAAKFSLEYLKKLGTN